jgi:hypothetical protein
LVEFGAALRYQPLSTVLSPKTTTWLTDWLAAGEQANAKNSAAPKPLDLMPSKFMTPPSQTPFVSRRKACLAGYIKV